MEDFRFVQVGIFEINSANIYRGNENGGLTIGGRWGIFGNIQVRTSRIKEKEIIT